MSFRAAVLIVFVAVAAQGASAGPVTSTTGNCSPIVSQNSGPVTIECAGVSEETQKNLVIILNEILKRQIDPVAVMSKLNEIAGGLETLKSKTTNLERGVTSTYRYNGAHLTPGPNGGTILQVGQQYLAFLEMTKLEKAEMWSELLKICDQEIKAAPEWLTPYLYSATADANVGNIKSARKKLEYVTKRAGADPAYGEAHDMLKKLTKNPR